MSTADLAAAADLPDHLADLADVVEASLEDSGWRGMSPAVAARRARAGGARCSSADVRQVMAYLIGRQRAHAAGTWRHIYAGPA